MLRHRVSSIIYDKLYKHGTKHTFLYSGGAIMPLVDHFHHTKNYGKISHIISSNEFSLTTSAVGYAKSAKNKVGVCVVTSGPGLTNCITPMLDAQADSTPLIVLSGQVPLKAMGTNAFQEAPSVDITKAITKWSYCLTNPGDTASVMDRAFSIATTGKPGVVHIDLPKCVLNSETEYDLNSEITKDIKLLEKEKERENPIRLGKIADMINESRRPVLYVGKGCIDAASELKKFAELGNIPVTTTLHALGTFDESHLLSLKMVGMHGHAAANYAIQNADLIIALGSRFDDRCTGNIATYAPKAKNILHINIEESEFNKVFNRTTNIHQDCKQFLDQITPHIKFNSRFQWHNQLLTWKINHPFMCPISPNKLFGQQVLAELNKQTKNKSNMQFTTGVGVHQMLVAQFLTHTEPRQIITSGSLGVMGSGLSYAIGAKLANPQNTIILIDGDQSFNMNSCDLKTIMNYGLNIKMIIMNDSTQSMVNVWEKLFFNNRITATTTQNPNYIQLAESYGIKAIKLGPYDNLQKKITEFLKYDKGPILLDAVIESSFCYPLVKPGSALDEMVFSDEESNKVITGNALAPN
jgi:acetolactate synthase-1/2/3 large subunit